MKYEMQKLHFYWVGNIDRLLISLGIFQSKRKLWKWKSIDRLLFPQVFFKLKENILHEIWNADAAFLLSGAEMLHVVCQDCNMQFLKVNQNILRCTQQNLGILQVMVMVLKSLSVET